MTDSSITKAAELLRHAYTEGVACEPVRDALDNPSIDTAYAVQQENTEYWMQQGRRLVGCKIGLTSQSVQRQLGVDQPDFGRLFADMAVCDGEAVALDAVLQPKAEAEVALVLEKDIDSEMPTAADLIRATAYALPAIEIVGSRIRNWDISIIDTIADNASSGLFVLGNDPRRLSDLDLKMCGMVMERRGDQVSVGAGLACLGHPINAAVWLARTMVQNGSPLRAGDIILTGALGPMVTVAPGDVLEARISGLGSVRAVFSGEGL